MKKYVITIMLVLTIILQGCSSKGGNTSSDAVSEAPTPTEALSAADSQAAAGNTEDAQAPEITVAATEAPKKELVLPLTANDSGKVLIQTVSKSKAYPYNSYIITSVSGESVVVDPTDMPLKSVIHLNPAAILCTHGHPDHTDSIFFQAYDVPEIMYEKKDIETKDFHIFSIQSSHLGDTIADNSRNVIIVFEVDGLRIAHMGDIGQTTLTQDQLDQLGEIDIAFMQFENSYSSMSVANAKGFTIIEQLNPKIIIPTHYTAKGLKAIEEKYGTITEFDNILEISADDLPETNLNVYRILNTHKYN
jgi:hypothetical protein